jgi:hypothetical protein
MNYSYKEQLEIIQGIHLKDGERKTLNCPFCNGRKKFSIGKLDGKIMWNCYKASCNTKGIYSGPRSSEEIRAYLNSTQPKSFHSKVNSLPQITSSVEHHLPALQYLVDVNAYDAYKEGLVFVRYDPREDRVVFYNRSQTGAVGRSLANKTPKWFTYGELPYGITVGKGSTVVLVEDVASACSVSRIKGYTGLALLGTTLTYPIKKTLSKYPRVVIILDNDAKIKALSMIKRIGRGATMRITTKDPKWLEQDELQALLKGEGRIETKNSWGDHY